MAQNPVPFTRGGGSIPPFGTNFLLHRAISEIRFVAARVRDEAQKGQFCRQLPTLKPGFLALRSKKPPRLSSATGFSELDQGGDFVGGILVLLRQDVGVDVQGEGDR